MDNVLVHNERHTLPYQLPLDAAKHFLRQIEEQHYVSWYDLIASELLSAIALEATVNTFGVFWIDDFGDFESANLVAKVRILCAHVGIPYDKSKKPFNDLIRLVRVRNKIVHPKFEKLTKLLGPMPLKDAQRKLREDLLTSTEKQINSNIAKKSYRAVDEFMTLLQEIAQERGDTHLLAETQSSKIVSDEINR